MGLRWRPASSRRPCCFTKIMCRAELVLEVVVLVLSLRRLTARHYRRISVEAHQYLLPSDTSVPELSGLVPFQPLVLRQHEAARPYTDKDVG